MSRPNIYKITSRVNFNKESTGGYIFAPNIGRYRVMQNIRKGDVFFYIFDGCLHAVSIATSDCYEAINAHERGEAGLYADMCYLIFSNPVDITMFSTDPNYQIRKREPYIRPFDYPAFIRLMIGAVKKIYPDTAFSMLLIEGIM